MDFTNLHIGFDIMIIQQSALGSDLQEMAAMLREAVNFRLGRIDIKLCLDVARRLDKAGADCAESVAGPVENLPMISVAMARGVLDIEQRGVIALLMFFVLNPGRAYSNQLIAEKTGYGVRSIPVYASWLKKSLSTAGIFGAVRRVRNTGYMMSVEDAAKIRTALPSSVTLFLDGDVNETPAMAQTDDGPVLHNADDIALQAA